MLRIATEKQTPFACKATKSKEKKIAPQRNIFIYVFIYTHIYIYIFLAATVVLE